MITNGEPHPGTIHQEIRDFRFVDIVSRTLPVSDHSAMNGVDTEYTPFARFLFSLSHRLGQEPTD